MYVLEPVWLRVACVCLWCVVRRVVMKVFCSVRRECANATLSRPRSAPSWTALSTCTPPALLTRSVHIISMAAAAQKGSVVGKPASDILLTDESTQEMATLRENIIDGKSTVVLEWWGFH